MSQNCSNGCYWRRYFHDMKNLSSVVSVFLLWATSLTFIAGCQWQPGLGQILPIEVTPTQASSVETPFPTPLPTPDQQGGASNADNPHDSFPYEKVDDFAKGMSDKLSGIVFYPQRESLYAVTDNGRIIEIKTDGTFIQKEEIRKKADFEGITYSPVTDMLYVAIEGEEVILEVNPKTLKVGRDIPINRTFEGRVVLAPEGHGVEGITFVPAGDSATHGSFYLVNQSKELEGTDPSIVFEVEINQAASEPQARIIGYFSVGLTDLSGIHYVPSRRRLLVISDANNVLLEVTLTGQVLETYPLPGKKQEGITTDADGFLYIAQDTKKAPLKFTSLDNANDTSQ
jgi:uncharacterized protein YjiK